MAKKNPNTASWIIIPNSGEARWRQPTWLERPEPRVGEWEMGEGGEVRGPGID